MKEYIDLNEKRGKMSSFWDAAKECLWEIRNFNCFYWKRSTGTK